MSMVSPPDPPGPKDSEGVLKAAIMLNSCFLNLHFNEPEINYSISSMYYEFPRRWIHAEMYRRTECFKTKSNGCEAVRECVGLAQTVGVKLPPTEPECADDLLQLSHHYIGKDFTVDTGIDITTWINCKGLDLHCFADFKQDWCSPPRTPCEPDDNAPGCLDGRPYRCADFSKGEEPEYYYYQKLRCSDYGLECPVDAYPAFPDCRATGPACDHKTGDADLAQFSYQYGIACENETTVRACIGGGEARRRLHFIGKPSNAESRATKPIMRVRLGMR
ncbi:MAG: hypothetical protein IPM54_45635 [Polyangiaceae bacterium]|nr:hypothetical protein [Polyangiaceae bacterium]